MTIDRVTIQTVDQIRDRIKGEVGAITDPTAAARHCMEMLESSVSSTENNSWAERYMYILWALVIHERHQVLTDTAVRDLNKLATLTFFGKGMKVKRSKLSYLVGNLHSVLSQIFRRRGNHWRALLEQYVAYHPGTLHKEDDTAFYLMSLGNRSLRMGYGARALEYFEKALTYPMTDAVKNRTKINLLLSYWLAPGPQFEANLCLLEAEENLPDNYRTELKWMRLCFETRSTGDVRGLLASLRKPEFEGVDYRVEATLWALAMLDQDTKERLPILRKRDRSLIEGGDAWVAVYDCAFVIQQWHLDNSPIEFRVRDLVNCLDRMSLIESIDKSLLVQAAAMRALYMGKQFLLVRPVLDEYVSTCLRLSDGNSKDVLGIVTDIIDSEGVRLAIQTKGAADDEPAQAAG